MDNQLTQIQIPIKSVIVVVAVLILACSLSLLGIYWQQLSDPYIKEVLTLKGDIIKGNAIFQINCAGCHGVQGDGIVGPSLRNIPRRKSKISLIDQVIGGKTPPMPKFQPNTQEMADLLSYLEQL